MVNIRKALCSIIALQADSLPTEPPGKPKNTGVDCLSLLQQIFWPRNWTGVSCIAGGLFNSWATSEALSIDKKKKKNHKIMAAENLSFFQNSTLRNSLAVQQLGLCTLTAEGPGSIPGWSLELKSHKLWCAHTQNPSLSLMLITIV